MGPSRHRRHRLGRPAAVVRRYGSNRIRRPAPRGAGPAPGWSRRGMSGRWYAAIVLAGGGLFVPGIAGAATPSAAATSIPPGAPSAARLQGQFVLEGTVTTARNVRGERVGQIVQRSWTFAPLCAAGPCRQVRLLRQRAAGSDTIALQERAPGHYLGTGFSTRRSVARGAPTRWECECRSRSVSRSRRRWS